MTALPLEGITVVSLEQAVAAPFATRQLADLGARVIKIERPGVGDFARAYDESVHGQSSYFVWLNRSKESVTLDLKSPGGREVLDRLLVDADVFVQNLAPAPPAGSASAPRILRMPPQADRLRHLRLRQPRPMGRPQGVRPAGPVRDRRRLPDGLPRGTREGRHLDRRHRCRHVRLLRHPHGADPARHHGPRHPVEVSLFEALSEWMGSPAYYTAYSGLEPARFGAQHATIAPYGPFTARDGGTVLLAIQNEREWASFCEIFLKAADIAADERFSPWLRPGGQPRGTQLAHRRTLRRPGRRRSRRVAGPGQCRQCPAQLGRRVLGPSGSGRP